MASDGRDRHPAAADQAAPDDIERQIRHAPLGPAIDEIDRRAAGEDGAVSTEGWLETACAWLCCAALVAMMVMTSAEVFTRAVFNYSFQITDDLGGYLLVGITFLSLAVCQVRRSFHHIEFVQGRLSRRGRAWSSLLFTGVSIVFIALLAWQLIGFEIDAWYSGDVAPTTLAAPLWIPQMVMPIGALILLYALLKTAWNEIKVLRRTTGSTP
jgi:TRAP-type C4-dicarboxylate transport system permease small subunit